MDIYPVNRLIARVAGKVSLRGVLIVPFVLQIVGTVGLVGYLSFKSGQKAVNDLGHQLINEVGDRVEHYLKTYLSTPQLINRINVDAIREGTINLQDLPKLERHMFVQLLQFNSVTSLVIGNERGDFRSATRTIILDKSKLGKFIGENRLMADKNRRIRDKARRMTDQTRKLREQSRKMIDQAQKTRGLEQNYSPLPTTPHDSQTFQLGGIRNGEWGDKGKLPQSPSTNNQPKITKIRFQIEDTGVGITCEQLEKIFLPFEQVGDTSRRAEGTGLGLSITEKLISLMGSKIWVESTPGIGSKFWFDLDLPTPSNSLQSISVKQTNTIIGYEGEKQKILLVDDRWENCSVIINLLEPLGFELKEAANGQEGLETAVEFQPNLIITDLVMPVIDGFEMTRRLRQLPEFQDTIVVATSASVFAGYRQKSLEFGCQDFLPKPIQLEALLDKIKHYLKLSWIYDKSHETQSQEIGDKSNRSPQVTPTEMSIPPREELIALYEAAKGGAVKSVEQEVLRLLELNPDYNFFTIRILELAQEFDYEEIVQLIDRYLLEGSK